MLTLKEKGLFKRHIMPLTPLPYTGIRLAFIVSIELDTNILQQTNFIQFPTIYLFCINTYRKVE
jgi:hypothetical protein